MKKQNSTHPSASDFFDLGAFTSPIEFLLLYFLGKDRFFKLRESSNAYFSDNPILRKSLLIVLIPSLFVSSMTFMSIAIFKRDLTQTASVISTQLIESIRCLIDHFSLTDKQNYNFYVIFSFYGAYSLVCSSIYWTSGSTLTPTIWRLGNSRDSNLDEREQSIKNHYYRKSYEYMTFCILPIALLSPTLGYFLWFFSLLLPCILASWNHEKSPSWPVYMAAGIAKYQQHNSIPTVINIASILPSILDISCQILYDS